MKLVKKVFPRMQATTANVIAKEDALICASGSRYLKTHKERHQVTACSRKMRELALILLEAKKLTPSITCLLYTSRCV